MRINKFLLCAIIFLSSCTQSLEFHINYEYRDAPNEQKVFVSYKNNFNKSICIPDGGWPRKTGNADVDSGAFEININGKKYGGKNYNSGFPPSRDLIVVNPGQEIVGELNYQDFEIPKSDFSIYKHVSMHQLGRFCKK